MKKYFLIGFITIGILSFYMYGAGLFSPGSYPNAEKYEIPVDESTLISIIQNFKNENPQFQVPKDVGLIDEKFGFNNLLYRINIYYPKENQILFLWTRSAGRQKTTLAFVAINDGLTLGNWKDINKDFSCVENKGQKEKFESRILDRITSRISK